MDEQDSSQLIIDDKSSSALLLHETETEKTLENNSEPQPDLNSKVYTQENENVITIITQENVGEVYIYDRNDIENAPPDSSTEFIQVCDTNSTYEELNNSEEKVVNVDEIEEEQGEVEIKHDPKLTTEWSGKEEENPSSQNKENTQTEDGNQTKNFKNVILEDWDVDVPPTVQNHESENSTEALVVVEEPQEVVTTCNSESTVVEVNETQDGIKENSSPIPEESSNNLEIPKENSVEENSVSESNKNSKLDKTGILETKNEGDTSMKNSSSHASSENSFNSQNDKGGIKDGLTPQLLEKRAEALKCPKSVTKEEIVKILDDSSERVIRPIVGGKDLFFSIELTKRLNQKLSPHGKSKTPEKHNETDSCNNNNTLDDRQKIVDILEADEIKDWKSVPSKSDLGPKENGNDMEISKAIKSMEEGDSRVGKAPGKTPRKTPLKKLRMMDKELERTLALQQLREEFPTTRKRSKASKKVNHAPFLASTVLEKAMTAPEVTTALKPGPPRRRPCYLPENTQPKEKDDVGKAPEPQTNSSLSDFELPGKPISNPVVKTYSAKRKSTETESEIKTTLEAVAKALTESSEQVTESKPKKQKTVTKENNIKKGIIKKKRKLKPGVKSEKKGKSELEKLLGDEGAVRMLYDTQHSDPGTASPKRAKFKTTTGLKNDLVLKTKLVKNAVMRLSGVGADGVVLRGKRRSIPTPAGQEEEPLFASTPNIVLYKPKKKQRAEASRILYRHSSSESFDSSEGYRRASFDETLDPAGTVTVEDSKQAVTTDSDKSQARGRPRKAEMLKKRLKKREKTTERKAGESAERLSTESLAGSRLNLSNVPVRKSSRPRVVSKKYSIWSSTSMDSLSVESLGLKKLKKASTELGKKLNCKELTILQYEHLVQVVLTPTTTIMKNSFNTEVLQELVQVFNNLSKDDSCRVVLLSSRGTTFCQGIDINKIISFSEIERKKGISQLVKAIRDFITCLAGFKKPVIAGVQGAAIGLGVTLLPYCDLIISSDTASFFTPYVKLGQAPEGAPIRTFPLIGKQLVSELLFKSQKMTAGEALKHGLVTQVIPEERFEEDLIMISRNMASQPVQGMQSIKYLLRKSEQWNVSGALDAEGELLEEHWNSGECLNNMIKFLNSGELQLKQGTAG